MRVTVTSFFLSLLIVCSLLCTCQSLHNAADYNLSYYDEDGKTISDYNTIVDFKNAYYRWPKSSDELLNYLSVMYSYSDRITTKAHRDMLITYVSEDTCFVRGGYFKTINESGVYVVSNPTISPLSSPLSHLSRSDYYSPSCFDKDGRFIPESSCPMAVGSVFQDGLNEVLKKYSSVIYEKNGEACAKKYFVLCYKKGEVNVSIISSDKIVPDNVYYVSDTGQELHVNGNLELICAPFLQDSYSYCERYYEENHSVKQVLFISLIGINLKDNR